MYLPSIFLLSSLHEVVSNRGTVSKTRGAILGAALGTAIGIPAGLLQDQLISLLPEDQQALHRKKLEQTEAIISGTVQHDRPERPSDYDPAGAVIRQLEASLQGSPTQAHKKDAVAGGGGDGEDEANGYRKKKGWSW